MHMSIFASELASLFLVALIWGTTNSLISKSSSKKNNKFLEILFDPMYIVPVIINLIGSLIFFYKLGNASNKITWFVSFDNIFLELSTAGPLTNSLTLAFTAVSGFFFQWGQILTKIYCRNYNGYIRNNIGCSSLMTNLSI